MEGFNKVLSFIFGLIVVVLVLFIIGTRFNITNTLLAFKPETKIATQKKVSITPTPIKQVEKKSFFSFLTRKPTTKPTQQDKTTTSKEEILAASNKRSDNQPTPVLLAQNTQQPISSIPKTGSPTILISLLFSSLSFGLLLRNRV